MGQDLFTSKIFLLKRILQHKELVKSEQGKMFRKMELEGLKLLEDKKLFNSYDYREALKNHNETFKEIYKYFGLNYISLQDKDIKPNLFNGKYDEYNLIDMDYENLPDVNGVKYVNYYNPKIKKVEFIPIKNDYVFSFGGSNTRQYIDTPINATQKELREIKKIYKNSNKVFDIIPKEIAKKRGYKPIKDKNFEITKLIKRLRNE